MSCSKQKTCSKKYLANGFILNVLIVVDINASCPHPIWNQRIFVHTPGFSLYITAFTVHATILGSC